MRIRRSSKRRALGGRSSERLPQRLEAERQEAERIAREAREAKVTELVDSLKWQVGERVRLRRRGYKATVFGTIDHVNENKEVHMVNTAIDSISQMRADHTALVLSLIATIFLPCIRIFPRQTVVSTVASTRPKSRCPRKFASLRTVGGW